MEYTSKLNLKKPDADEFVNVSDLNDNFDTIDGILGATKDFSATFTASGWIGSSAPYSQTVSCEGILSTDKPIVCLSYPSTINSSNAEDYEEAFGYISKISTADGTLTAVCLYEKPSVDVSVELRV